MTGEVQQQVTSPRRLPTLDGWRAVSISIVLVSHLAYTVHPDSLNAFFDPMIVWGSVGVRVFFGISGFLITYLLLVEAKHTGRVSLARFYARRAVRILPVYACYLAVVAGLQVAGWTNESGSSWLGSLTFTRNMIGRGDSATVHLWSLSIEEQFYLFWPPLFALLSLHRRPIVAISILVTAALAAFAARLVTCEDAAGYCSRLFGEHATVRYLDSISLGCAAAFIMSIRREAPPPGGIWAYSSAALLLATCVLPPINPLNYSLIVAGQAMLAASAMYWTVRNTSNGVSAVLNTRLFVAVGVLSYSIYIWHPLLLKEFTSLPSDLSAFVQDWRVGWIFALSIAAMSYYWLERPLVRLRSRLAVR